MYRKEPLRKTAHMFSEGRKEGRKEEKKEEKKKGKKKKGCALKGRKDVF